jgi:pSer/pThr/pTyr-binding forkhead associated (FHA) protein
MSIWLVMQSADGSERQFSLRKPRTVIGRETTCDVRVPIPSVGRKHCEIIIEQGGDDPEAAARLSHNNGDPGAQATRLDHPSSVPDADQQPRARSIRVTDLGSEQGTYHNGVRVQQADLSHADTLVIGPVTFVVRVDESAGDDGAEDAPRVTDILIERRDAR